MKLLMIAALTSLVYTTEIPTKEPVHIKADKVKIICTEERHVSKNKSKGGTRYQD